MVGEGIHAIRLSETRRVDFWREREREREEEEENESRYAFASRPELDGNKCLGDLHMSGLLLSAALLDFQL